MSAATRMSVLARQTDRQTDREGCSQAPRDCHQAMLPGTDSFSLSGRTGQRGMEPWGWHSHGQRPGLLGTAPARAAPAAALSRRETGRCATSGRVHMGLRKCLKKNLQENLSHTKRGKRDTGGPCCMSGRGWLLQWGRLGAD